MLCGPKVPVVNIHTMLVKVRHRMATRIQAWFKGALVREWVHQGRCRSWDAVNKYTLSDAWATMHDPREVDGFIQPWPDRCIKMETVERLNGRPFGGVRVVFHYHKFLKFHLSVPSSGDTIQLGRLWSRILYSRINPPQEVLTRAKMGGPRTPCQDCYCLTCRCNW